MSVPLKMRISLSKPIREGADFPYACATLHIDDFLNNQEALPGTIKRLVQMVG